MRAETCWMILGAMCLLVSCQEGPVERGAWVPAIEQTGFESLSTSGERIKKALQTGREQLAEGHRGKALASLDDAEAAVQILLYYDIPMTEVRQLVYDASRLHAMNRPQFALDHLNRSAEILLKLGEQGELAARQTAETLRGMISELSMLLEEELALAGKEPRTGLSNRVAGKFEELGIRVNLLVLKRDLLLNEAGLTHDRKANAPR